MIDGQTTRQFHATLKKAPTPDLTDMVQSATKMRDHYRAMAEDYNRRAKMAQKVLDERAGKVR